MITSNAHARGQCTPLFGVAVAALDQVAVVAGIEADRPAPARVAALTVAFLVVGLGAHGLDPASAQVGADRLRGIRFVAADDLPVGAGA